MFARMRRQMRKTKTAEQRELDRKMRELAAHILDTDPHARVQVDMIRRRREGVR